MDVFTRSHLRFPILLKAARLYVVPAGDILHCHVFLRKLLHKRFHNKAVGFVIYLHSRSGIKSMSNLVRFVFLKNSFIRHGTHV